MLSLLYYLRSVDMYLLNFGPEHSDNSVHVSQARQQQQELLQPQLRVAGSGQRQRSRDIQ